MVMRKPTTKQTQAGRSTASVLAACIRSHFSIDRVLFPFGRSPRMSSSSFSAVGPHRKYPRLNAVPAQYHRSAPLTKRLEELVKMLAVPEMNDVENPATRMQTAFCIQRANHEGTIEEDVFVMRKDQIGG
ncbi:MAG: hypothetical protein LQ340_000156 [Diploschistes diacapsis]|nr:MAG: hypothetical protein LQ340_000156 [Diploschistes diacapsis]